MGWVMPPDGTQWWSPFFWARQSVADIPPSILRGWPNGGRLWRYLRTRCIRCIAWFIFSPFQSPKEMTALSACPNFLHGWNGGVRVGHTPGLTGVFLIAELYGSDTTCFCHWWLFLPFFIFTIIMFEPHVSIPCVWPRKENCWRKFIRTRLSLPGWKMENVVEKDFGDRASRKWIWVNW